MDKTRQKAQAKIEVLCPTHNTVALIMRASIWVDATYWSEDGLIDTSIVFDCPVCGKEHTI
jgi:hypothetical protein